MIKSLFIAALTFTLNFYTFGQENRVSHTVLGRENPIYLNPAFSGSEMQPRVIMSYGANSIVFSKSTNSIVTSKNLSASFDTYIPALRGGIGVRVNLVEANGQLNGAPYSFVNGSYSPKISSSKKVTLAPVIDLGIDRLVYGDQSEYYLNSGIGTLINTKKSHVGIFHAIDWLEFGNQHNTRAHIGHRFDLSKKMKLGFETQYIRESRRGQNTYNFTSHSIQITSNFSYQKIKVTAGIYKDEIKQSSSFDYGEDNSKLTPMIGLGYHTDQFSIHGNLILPRTREFYSPYYILPQDQDYGPNSYQTESTFEIALGYKFKVKE